MKTLLTIALIAGLTATANARTFEKADLSKAIEAYTVDVNRPANTINLNASMMASNKIRFAVKRSYQASTIIKVRCKANKCYVKFIENVQPKLNAPKHFNLVFKK